MSDSINSQIIKATKWSSATEIIVKLITPITNMILARILSPETFGIVATITMIISFADMFTDSGFQKYLVQHEFKNEEEKYKNTNVAFWTNLCISMLLWFVIAVFCEPIAALVGSPGLGIVIIVACSSLPLTSFSSIQMALYKRDFNFKTLFYVRIIGACIPFVVTIPLALLGFGYWALVIGTIMNNLINAIILTIKSKWKPTKFYSYYILKEMISFSIWTLMESISIWLTLWGDTFIVGSMLNSYYLGIYKTSMSTVNGITAIITGATTSVMFSALSRLQNKDDEYKITFFRFQRLVALLIMPIGVGIFMYRDLVTSVLLGSQWVKASQFIGLWGLMSALTIVLSHYSSEVYRSKGKPKLSLLSQTLHLIVLIPVVYINVQKSFDTLVYARSLIRLEGILVNLILMFFVIRISPWKMIKNVLPQIFCTIPMGGLAYLLQRLSSGTIWSIISIIICAVFYFMVAMLFSSLRIELIGFIRCNKRTLKSEIKIAKVKQRGIEVE